MGQNMVENDEARLAGIWQRKLNRKSGGVSKPGQYKVLEEVIGQQGTGVGAGDWTN